MSSTFIVYAVWRGGSPRCRDAMFARSRPHSRACNDFPNVGGPGPRCHWCTTGVPLVAQSVHGEADSVPCRRLADSWPVCATQGDAKTQVTTCDRHLSHNYGSPWASSLRPPARLLTALVLFLSRPFALPPPPLFFPLRRPNPNMNEVPRAQYERRPERALRDGGSPWQPAILGVAVGVLPGLARGWRPVAAVLSICRAITRSAPHAIAARSLPAKRHFISGRGPMRCDPNPTAGRGLAHQRHQPVTLEGGGYGACTRVRTRRAPIRLWSRQAA